MDSLYISFLLIIKFTYTDELEINTLNMNENFSHHSIIKN